ncbi:MAG: PilZ domain-containing protein [Planctomycetes bacterium]|nr:PilZ domain-containing protein [Planctomycetota bacterium]
MAAGSGSERRRFTRVSVDLPVQYKFTSLDPRKPVAPDVHTGFTRNISQGGLLLIGRIPNLDWISPLLMSRIVVGITLELSADKSDTVKSLCRAAWLETVEEKSQRAAFGLIFSEISRVDQEKVLQFVMKSQT